jgi:hypothetical protein
MLRKPRLDKKVQDRLADSFTATNPCAEFHCQRIAANWGHTDAKECYSKSQQLHPTIIPPLSAHPDATIARVSAGSLFSHYTKKKTNKTMYSAKVCYPCQGRKKFAAAAGHTIKMRIFCAVSGSTKHT